MYQGCAYFAIISAWMQFNVLCDVSKKGSMEIVRTIKYMLKIRASK